VEMADCREIALGRDEINCAILDIYSPIRSSIAVTSCCKPVGLYLGGVAQVARATVS
jgi:hypothetical protein